MQAVRVLPRPDQRVLRDRRAQSNSRLAPRGCQSVLPFYATAEIGYHPGMNRDKYLSLACETFWLQRFFNDMPESFPGRRELLIQINKLERLLSQRVDPDFLKIGSASIKKERKAIGEHDRRCGLQARHVRLLTEKSCKEAMQFTWRTQGKPYRRKAFAEWNTQFKQAVKTQVQQVMKQLQAARKGMLPSDLMK
jgi:hypothetical protein